MTSKTKKIIGTLALSDMTLDKAVKIANTKFDRHVRFSEEDVRKMKKMFDKGITYKDIAAAFDTSVAAIRYRVDAQYRALLNSRKRPYHTKPVLTPQNRAEYKRSLVAAGKIFAEV